MRTMIPHSRPLIGKDECHAVKKVLLSGHLSQDKEVTELEHELCSLVGHRYGLAVSSGTTALYGALKILDVNQGDVVVIPSFVCTALANAVYMCGARPVLCEVEYENGLMSVATVEKALVKNTRAIIVPHLFGIPAPAADIQRVTGIPVIEDCAQCLGTTDTAHTVGGQTAVSIFSFYATKVLCAGEGGLIAVSNARLAHKLESLREYDNHIKWVPQINMKCSDVHAAIARVQLQRLNDFIHCREMIAHRYTMAVDEVPTFHTFPEPGWDTGNIYYRYLIRVNSRLRSKVMSYFRENKIACSRPIFKPFHHYCGIDGFPITEKLYNELLSIPLYPSLKEGECRHIEKVILHIADKK